MASVIGRGYNAGVSYTGGYNPVGSNQIHVTPPDQNGQRHTIIYNEPNIESGLASGFAKAAGTDPSFFGDIIRGSENFSDRSSALSQQYAERQMDFQREADTYAMAWSAQEAAKNREWQEHMSSTAHQREVADLLKSGLNPILSAGGQGASTPAGSMGQAFTSAGAMGNVDMTNPLNVLQGFFSDMLNTAFSMKMHDDQMNLSKAELASRERIANIQADANIISSKFTSAAAAYSADQHLAGVRESNEANRLISEMNNDAQKYRLMSEQDWQSIEKQNQRDHETEMQYRDLVKTMPGLMWVLGTGFGSLSDADMARAFKTKYFGDFMD